MFNKQKLSIVLLAAAVLMSLPITSGYAWQQPEKKPVPLNPVIKDKALQLPKVGAALYANPKAYKGKCPAHITFKGHIAATGRITFENPVAVQYAFIRSDGATGPVETLTFTKQGSQNVSTTWQLGGGDLTSYDGWVAIKIISPEPKESKKASFSMKCSSDGQAPPGQPPQQGQLPDLSIAEIALNEQCFVTVRVKNNGPGMVPDEVWSSRKPDSPGVYLLVNGKKWGGYTIWFFDTAKALKAPGGETVVTTEYKVKGTETITAVIDLRKQLKETNESNNKAAKKLVCKAGPTAPLALGKEDCVSFNPDTATVSQPQGSWKVTDGDHWLFDFASKKDEADKTLAIIKHYNMNRSCFVGRPQASFHYMLISGASPAGPFAGEDCVPFNPATITVKQMQGDWKIVDGNHWMFSFGSKKNEADQTLAIIKKYGFTRSCFVGRPGASFTYMRK